MWFLNFALSYTLRTPPTRTRTTTPRMGPAEWLEAGGTEPLPLLPFGIHELLLPGETKQLHLFEARFLTLFDRAAQGHGCLSQLLLTPAGGVLGLAMAVAEGLAKLPAEAVASAKRFFEPSIMADAERLDNVASRMFARDCESTAAKATLSRFTVKK